MPIVYALVAREKAVLAEYTSTSGNFPTVTRVLLSKIPAKDGKMSYVWDNFVFHYVVENGITYMCMADEEARRRLPFAFLEEVKRLFCASYGMVMHTALAFSMNSDFAPILRQQMELHNEEGVVDSMQGVKAQIEDVRQVMVENVEKVLERGEKIELLVDKTDQLSTQAFRFDRASRRLRRHMYWHKVKAYVALGVGVSALVFMAAASACGGLSFPKC
ncbi:unnamed protein product [Discosporangium mesarthrocarpum]